MKKNNKKVSVLVLTTILVLAMSSVALAVPNPGVKAQSWVLSNVQALFVAGVAIVGLTLAFTRSLMKALVSFVFVAIAAAFIYGGDGLGQALGKLIQSFF